jgi:hypothetical protein
MEGRQFFSYNFSVTMLREGGCKKATDSLLPVKAFSKIFKPLIIVSGLFLNDEAKRKIFSTPLSSCFNYHLNLVKLLT